MKCELEKHMQLAQRKSINLHTHRASISDKLPKQHQSAVHFQDKPKRIVVTSATWSSPKAP